MVDYDEGFAKGHDQLTHPNRSSVPADAQKGTQASSGGPAARLTPTADAVSGITLEFLAPPLPSVEGAASKYNFKKGPYLFAPNFREAKSNAPKVVYYYAYRLDKNRNEYVIGPDSLDTFLGNLDSFKAIGDSAYADPTPSTTSSGSATRSGTSRAIPSSST